MIADFVVRASRLLTPEGPAPCSGADQGRVRGIADAAVASLGGRIVFAGARSDCDRTVTPSADALMVESPGCTILPGFVDPHTHAVYAGDRREELRRRLGGATYAQIAAEGGGILSTVRATRAASEEELIAESRSRLVDMLRCGTTTAEVKSGYGLDLETELKMLRVIRRLGQEGPIDLVPTFLGAHEVPPEYRSRRDEFLALVTGEILEAVVGDGLAEWCDVFCEAGVFTPAESARVLEAGARGGLKPRIHADEFGRSGGSALAGAVKARSADHLIFAERAEIEGLAAAGTIATLAPIAALCLKIGRFAPARAFIDAGVPVALATDLNPGGGLSPSMPFAITLACFAMNMTLEEAIVAATLNAACAIDRHDRVGSLEAGKQMDAMIVRGEPIDLLRVGADAIQMVIKTGRIVVDRGPAVSEAQAC